MIPTTQEELDKLVTPGDVIHRAVLEPFHFSWSDVSAFPGTISNILAVGADGEEVKIVSRASADFIAIHSIGVSYASTSIGTANACMKADWCAGYAYTVDGSSVYKDGVLLFTAPGTIEDIGAVGEDDIYFGYSTGGTTRMAHYHDSAIEYSDIYWCGTVDYITAEAFDDHDVVVLSCELPSYMKADVSSGSLQWTEEARSGVIAFTVYGTQWSEHYTIDVGETANYTVSEGKAFASNGLVGVVSHAESYINEFSSVSISPDGRAWTFPVPLTYPVSTDDPFMVATPTYIYAIGSSGMQRSPIFRLFGVVPDGLDISDYVLSCALSTDQRTMASLMVDYSSTISDYVGEGSVILRLYTGYTYSDASIEKLVFTGEIDAHSLSMEESAAHQIEMVFRDVTAFLDRSQSPLTIEASGIETTMETYADPTGTGYGGLSRTATYRGSWKAEDGILKALADGTNLAFYTGSNVVNGEISTYGSSDGSDNDIFGVVYRAISENKMLRLVYVPADHSLLIQQVDGDTITTLGSYLSLSGNSQWIRAKFRYGKHVAQVSSDGITWTSVIEAITPNHPHYGAMGLLAGQQIINVSDPWTPVWPDPPWEPPEEVVPDALEDAVVVIYMDSGEQAIYFCSNILATPESWTNITGSLSITGRVSVVIFGAYIILSTDDTVYSYDVDNGWAEIAPPTGYTYGSLAKMPFVQKNGSSLLIPVWDGIDRYAWILDTTLTETSLFKIGVQLYPGTDHASWSGDDIIAGHCNATEDDCPGELYSTDTPPVTSCANSVTDGHNRQSSVSLALDADDSCWHYATVTFTGRLAGYNNGSNTTLYASISASTTGGAQLYDNGWTTTFTKNRSRIVMHGDDGQVDIDATLRVRFHSIHATFWGVVRVSDEAAIEVYQSLAKACWAEDGEEPYVASPSGQKIYHPVVPLDYAGDINSLCSDACCDTTGDLDACPSWANNIVLRRNTKMIMDNGTNLEVQGVNVCSTPTASTADVPIHEQNQGVNVVYIGSTSYAINDDATDIMISTDDFVTYTTVALPSYIGTAGRSLAIFNSVYLIVYGIDGVAIYNPASGNFTDITGDLVPGSVGVGDSNIGASS